MREREREREKGREGGAIHMLLIHSIFVVAFFLFFTLRTVCVFCICYKIDVISSNAYRSVVFDLEKCSISKTLFQVFK